ncbi:hypothetical protein A7K93_11005 [Candidatus Methylacidiphilum fumarolicum]|uniref:Uncharacterized protein n=2 Tax=Candidatus Methylacidiphilum fumarolicum TaxID=591154 RepID=I0K057_METFB|nr:hypothetical protein [Candidatus Methylacidiphilum fumarolicum]MBW6414274.1 hypothetical protein [Candidatus Methylacidiphilum fumarolicum]TFE70962.1 hypothetical protein A7K73_00100 [Candidatus Methylacidiphilum fumarolicum]TFE71372.1 hypothetical protein A7K93_11005 [Candidatus Methylacidiphilum fumarolicum]TFE74414.1 hypothetical protein A7K72_04075 [Candidatus Methylacidiphilum fumarolicum]TFE76849.1 hypothetical protein A7D33_07950 [Candidatus Methylacidiphilum fumarolicum]
MEKKTDETTGKKEPFWGIGELVVRLIELLEAEIDYFRYRAWSLIFLLLLSLILLTFSVLSLFIGFLYSIWGLYLLFSAEVGKIGGAFLCASFMVVLSGFFLWMIKKIANRMLK